MPNLSMMDASIHNAVHSNCDHTMQGLFAERVAGESSTRVELDQLLAELTTLRARVPLLEAAVDAALEVWWDKQMPSRWIEDSLYHVKEEHDAALEAAFKAAGRELTLKFGTVPPTT